ncbi:HepA-related protein [Bacillus phage vB_BcoS-136]|uniref:HepA-related protein n=1 Tax=Bacillus phage vB_BcoS-136 TaxID=2419619 RepID=A0A3G3BV76_9CAUD|nr:HepA-related protein [Bacillus phage vB_BcoS-136]AYP68137.1 HepA-related protein [Bacillus phage vB_BcoS-136]
MKRVMKMENKIFSVEELVQFNEKMLGRGMPVMEDGIGYNKADYGACANYFYGMSYPQVADLAKRLMKYCKTQLGLDRSDMKATAEYYMMKVTGEFDRTEGVSVNITEKGTLISFRYNELFIEIIKRQPKRQYDAETKQWIVPNENAIKTLKALEFANADVRNAIEYAESHELIKNAKPKKTTVECKAEGLYTIVSFKYNKEIVETIKELKDRKYDVDNKSWKIQTSALKFLTDKLNDIADFKLVQ